MLADRKLGAPPLDAEGARALAIDALGFLAGDPVLMNRFLQLSGLEAHELRMAAADPAFFAGLLDFILADERTLTAFAAETAIAPASVGRAREALSGHYGGVER